MTWSNTRVKNKLLYKTERTFVNVSTGEEIIASLDYIKKNFKTIKKDVKVTYNGYTRTQKELWVLQPKPTQLQLTV